MIWLANVGSTCAGTNQLDGGAVVKKILRDSTAERPRFARKRQRVSSKQPPPAAPLPQPSASPAPLAEVSPSRDSSTRLPEPVKRGCTRTTRLRVDPATQVRTRKRLAVDTTARLQELAEDESRVARWISSRTLSATDGPQASDRVDAVRARLRLRLAS